LLCAANCTRRISHFKESAADDSELDRRLLCDVAGTTGVEVDTPERCPVSMR
jgi:hypothetical protein